MGSSGSREKGTDTEDASPTSPTVHQTPVNLLVTREVTERWETLARKNWEDKLKELELKRGGGVVLDADIGGAGDASVSLEKGTVAEKMQDHSDALPADVLLNDNDEKKSTDDTLETINEEEKPQLLPAPFSHSGTDGEIDETNEELREKMEKFTEILSRNEFLKSQPNDIETGVGAKVIIDVDGGDDDIGDFNMMSLLEPDRPASVSSSSSSDNLYQLPEYEEINEVFSAKSKSADLGDGENNEGTSIQTSDCVVIDIDMDMEPVEPLQLQEIPIPMSVLPVVIDQDDDGTPTIQTIRAWQMKENLERELERNDELWVEEMKRLTTKIEDSTVRCAEDVDRRIQELEVKYPDLIATSPDGIEKAVPCDVFTTRISTCYLKNRNEILKCNNLARQFAQCTRKSVNDKYNLKV